MRVWVSLFCSTSSSEKRIFCVELWSRVCGGACFGCAGSWMFKAVPWSKMAWAFELFEVRDRTAGDDAQAQTCRDAFAGLEKERSANYPTPFHVHLPPARALACRAQSLPPSRPLIMTSVACAQWYLLLLYGSCGADH